MKQIVILGSTGSIGTSALDVISRLGKDYQVLGLSANNNTDLFLKQLHAFKPRFAAVLNPASYEKIKDQIPQGTRLLPPEIDSLMFMASLPSAGLVINGVVGAVGFMPLIAAIKAGKTIALANKEPMVMAGRTIMQECERWQAAIIPVDSEPSAIFQCLCGMTNEHGYHKIAPDISRVFLTASGGPFRNWDQERIRRATPAEALRHPNWNMGAKITVDSASMFNKGLEIMEARWLFDLPEDRIEVVVHPESIVHSAVVFRDGAVLAQLGLPDMRVPIGYAMAYPERLETGVEPPDLFALGSLTFEKPDERKFPALRLAREALRAGGAACTVFNGANEEAVAAFLREEIPFGEIARRVENAMDKLNGLPADNLEEILDADRRAREAVRGAR